MAADERTVREQKRAAALYSSVLNVANGISWPAAMAIARAELEREGRLVAALDEAERWASHGIAPRLHHTLSGVLAAYGAEFAPKPRTVEQIAADLVAVWSPPNYVPPLRSLRYEELLDELSAALAARKEGV